MWLLMNCSCLGKQLATHAHNESYTQKQQEVEEGPLGEKKGFNGRKNERGGEWEGGEKANIRYTHVGDYQQT